MVTLSNFYKTSSWTKFRQRVIADRTRDDGLCYCDLCGKPIVKNIVAHHIEELTEYNITDPDISLNDENIMLLHIDCHNKIHNRFQKPKYEIVLVYGPPLSFLDYVEAEAGLNDFVISLDYIYKALNPQHYLSTHTQAVVDLAMHVVRDALVGAAKDRYGTWDRCFICGGFENRNERERIKRELGIDKEVFIDITKEEAYELGKKYNVHPSYYKYIDDWFRDIVR